MVHNGILMETIGISVMVSIGLLLFFFLAGSTLAFSSIFQNFLIQADMSVSTLINSQSPSTISLSQG